LKATASTRYPSAHIALPPGPTTPNLGYVRGRRGEVIFSATSRGPIVHATNVTLEPAESDLGWPSWESVREELERQWFDLSNVRRLPGVHPTGIVHLVATPALGSLYETAEALSLSLPADIPNPETQWRSGTRPLFVSARTITYVGTTAASEDPNEPPLSDRVHAILESPEWEFHTISGLASRAHASDGSIKIYLEHHPELIRWVPALTRRGHQLLRSADKPVTRQERILRIRAYLTKSLPIVA